LAWGTKLRWNNTPFNLIPYDFMGESFLIPEDYDLYLTENYGSWMLEKRNLTQLSIQLTLRSLMVMS
jgi:hypothetical protein